MGHHGGAQELMLVVVFSSTILLAIGVYLRNRGHMDNSAFAGLWTALTMAPLLFGAARFLGYA
jgi:hypothetical protein